jgi:hypothetical protein
MKTSSTGAQTEPPEDAGPVRLYLQMRTHRPFLFTPKHRVHKELHQSQGIFFLSFVSLSRGFSSFMPSSASASRQPTGRGRMELFQLLSESPGPQRSLQQEP